jgi:uncharacterized protein involved in cysteine biosynthesis
MDWIAGIIFGTVVEGILALLVNSYVFCIKFCKKLVSKKKPENEKE